MLMLLAFIIFIPCMIKTILEKDVLSTALIVVNILLCKIIEMTINNNINFN